MNMTAVITLCTGVVFTWMTPLGDDDDDDDDGGEFRTHEHIFIQYKTETASSILLRQMETHATPFRCTV